MTAGAPRLPSAAELEQLRNRLREAEETIEAIRTGVVDALIVQGEDGDQVFTLKDASEPYRLLVERMAEGALSLNLAGDVLYTNQRFAEMIGAPLEQVAGRSALSLVEPRHRVQLAGAIERGAAEALHHKLELQRADGSLFPALLALAPLKVDGADLVSAIVSDLTERKRVEEVAASERFVRAVLEQISNAVLIYDELGRITHLNESAAALLGADAIGTAAQDLPLEIVSGPPESAGPPPSLAEVVRSACRGRDVRGLEAALKRGDGGYLLLNCRKLQATGTGRPSCILSLTDISERRRAEERQGLLVAELDHRVKNTLATIQSIALRTLGVGEAADAFLGRIAALANAHSVLSQTEWAGVGLADLLSGLFAAHQAGAARLSWEGPPVVLDARSAQVLALSLNELGTNASKYGALSALEGRVRMRWEVTRGDRPMLQLDWREFDGPPVQPPARYGFGMELIQKSLQYELGAEVDLQFHPAGVSCRIVMPIGPNSSRRSPKLDPAAAERPAANGGAKSLAGRLILVVEDSHVVAAELCRALEASGAIVAGPVASVRQAFELTEKIDAAVLDINLHGEMIFPVASALKSRGTPMVLLTGYDGGRVVPEALRDIPVVNKPATSTAVLAALLRQC
jgi:PAS domain S-box-containing protein